MKAAEFYQYVANPQLLQAAALPALQEIVQEYPFCEAAWMLMLKALSNSGSIRYENELRRSSAYIGVRSALFDLINKVELEPQTEPETVAAPQAQPTITSPLPQAADTSDYFSDVSSELPVFAAPTADYFQLSQTSEQLDDGSRASFAQWLNYVETKQQQAEPQSGSANADLIETFLSGLGQMQRPAPHLHAAAHSEVHSAPDHAQRDEASEPESEGILTETLANIYVQQHQYAKAINIFKKLCLKNPEKSVYFASRISQIEKLNE